MKHCIKAVWEKQHVPEDADGICKICLDMVGQARDQLESNETQEEIKEVFEGSCDLMPIKIVKKECKRLADDFIPELIEALASQMNPQVSVNGLRRQNKNK
jgi:saposin